jgi:integrase
MATIRKRGEHYHVQVRVTGFPTRTASFRSKKAATEWVRLTEGEMAEGKHFRNVEARRRTLADAIDRYLNQEVGKLRDGRMHRSVLPWWREQLGSRKLAQLTPALITEYRDRLAASSYTRARPDSKRSIVKGEPRRFKRSAQTVNNYLVVLGSLFTTARRQWHWTSYNPVADVAKLSTGRGRVRYLSEDERKRLLTETAKDAILHTFVVLALATAARAGELWNLRWGDVELREGQLLLRVTKNAQPRSAWVQGEALRLLEQHGKVRRLGDDRVFVSPKGRRYRYQTGFVAACRAANVQGFRFHDLRHSAATYLAREGATEQQLRAIGGWKSSVVSRYVHLAAQDARTVVAKMNDKILGPRRS